VHGRCDGLAAVWVPIQIVKYVIAILIPPLGMLLVGRIFQAFLCLILMITLIGWPLAAIWALLVVNSAETETRIRRQIERERFLGRR
jgi:uncharacterized membrane protein YqaE (UPF0057 family)